ncbi:MAG: prepilin-type N-terminal cleavage/methylation domain-containing protein [bacterium]|nr:prepilin-type N-terminal cleavage/methylation domain-containing protein [bacterium]
MNKKGFTLIELLIVIAIIGIVAAIAVPNLLTALQKGKQKATMGDMKTVGTSVSDYMTDNYMAPGGGTINAVGDLADYLTPFYMQVIPARDGWGTQMVYDSGAADSPDQDKYSIVSYGRGGTSNAFTIDDSGYVVNSMAGFENDICFSNGSFTYTPKVK